VLAFFEASSLRTQFQPFTDVPSENFAPRYKENGGKTELRRGRRLLFLAEFLEARIISQRVEHRIEAEQLRGEG
jgi:hypothetical protein